MDVRHNDVFKKREGGLAGALWRLSRDYPAEYAKVMEQRKIHERLYSLDADKFDKVLAIALKSLIKEGICKRPRF